MVVDRLAYARREIEYPIDHILTLVMQGRDAGAVEDPNAAEYLRAWIYMHYGVELPLPHEPQSGRPDQVGVAGHQAGEGLDFWDTDAVCEAVEARSRVGNRLSGFARS